MTMRYNDIGLNKLIVLCRCGIVSKDDILNNDDYYEFWSNPESHDKIEEALWLHDWEHTLYLGRKEKSAQETLNAVSKDADIERFFESVVYFVDDAPSVIQSVISRGFFNYLRSKELDDYERPDLISLGLSQMHLLNAGMTAHEDRANGDEAWEEKWRERVYEAFSWIYPGSTIQPPEYERVKGNRF